MFVEDTYVYIVIAILVALIIYASIATYYWMKKDPATPPKPPGS